MDRFRGSAPARLEEKGRLKVPNLFRQQIEEAFGADMFVTSLHGREVLLYPLPIWRALVTPEAYDDTPAGAALRARLAIAGRWPGGT